MIILVLQSLILLLSLFSMAISGTDWLEVPTIYKAYFLGLCKGISPQNMALNGTWYSTSILGSWNSHRCFATICTYNQLWICVIYHLPLFTITSCVMILIFIIRYHIVSQVFIIIYHHVTWLTCVFPHHIMIISFHCDCLIDHQP